LFTDGIVMHASCTRTGFARLDAREAARAALMLLQTRARLFTAGIQPGVSQRAAE
jgi:hypothetical protein